MTQSAPPDLGQNRWQGRPWGSRWARRLTGGRRRRSDRRLPRTASGQKGEIWKAASRHGGVPGGTISSTCAQLLAFGLPGLTKVFRKISFVVFHLTSLGEHLDKRISFSHYISAFLMRKDLNPQISRPHECWFKYQTPTQARRVQVLIHSNAEFILLKRTWKVRALPQSPN